MGLIEVRLSSMTNWNPATTTTQDLIATISHATRAHEDFIAACIEFSRRTRSDWRTFARIALRDTNIDGNDPSLQEGSLQ